MRYFLFLSALLLSILISCESKLDPVSSGSVRPTLDCIRDNTQIQGAETYAIYDLYGDILFAVDFEKCYCCDPQRTAICIHQVSDYIYSWYNLTILCDIEVGPGRIDITHRGINVPNILQDALGPANAWAYFDIPDGIYRLTFHDNGVSDTYRLTIADDEISVHTEETSYTHYMVER